MGSLHSLDWPARILIGALVAGAVGGGAFLLVRTSGDDDPQAAVQQVDSPTATPTPTALADALPTPTPTPTALPPTPTATAPDVPPAPTRDTRVAVRDLPTLNQIQLAKDGTYFIADRGDGCTWAEALRTTSPNFGEEVILRTGCAANFQFVYRIETGEVILVLP